MDLYIDEILSYKEMFYGKPFRYYNIGKFKYWSCGNILNRCAIGNRFMSVGHTFKRKTYE